MGPGLLGSLLPAQDVNGLLCQALSIIATWDHPQRFQSKCDHLILDWNFQECEQKNPFLFIS